MGGRPWCHLKRSITPSRALCAHSNALNSAVFYLLGVLFQQCDFLLVLQQQQGFLVLVLLPGRLQLRVALCNLKQAD